MRATTIILILTLAACGGGNATVRSTSSAGGGEETTFFIEVAGTRTELLRADERPISELEAERDRARGADRRRALVNLARAHMLAAGESTDREQRRHRSAAERYAAAAAAGTRDADILAATSFIELWLAYRAGDRTAAARAARFTTRHSQSGELALLAWVLRGELAFAADAWDEAMSAYRYVLGQLEHPLYAYALYRTAQSQERAGQQEQAHEAYGEVVLLGCATGVGEPTRQMALRVARQQGIAIARDPTGVERPGNCPEPGGGADENSAWRPEE